MEGIVYVIVKFKNLINFIKTVTDRIVEERSCRKFIVFKENFDILTGFLQIFNIFHFHYGLKIFYLSPLF